MSTLIANSDAETFPFSAYIEPADRTVAWAAMAAGLLNDGRSIRQIAEALWVDEPTAEWLLGLAGRRRPSSSTSPVTDA